MAEQSVTLQPSEAKAVTFEAIPHEARTYHVLVDGLSGSFVAIRIIANLSGTVTDAETGTPLSGVRVTLEKGIAQTYTDVNGAYRFEGLTAGAIAVFFEKAGYNKEGKLINLVGGGNQLNAQLTSTAVFDGEIITGSARWKYLRYPKVISSTINRWPANTSITTMWQVKNTGNVTALFTLVYSGQQGSIQLTPGEKGWIKDLIFNSDHAHGDAKLYADSKLVDSQRVGMIYN